MLRFNEIVFGPIHSRRLGSSLGVNLLPWDGKLCNFDCIYCECGWNRDGMCKPVLPDAEQVRRAMEEKLRQCSENGTVVDSITFSGNGEPTLNPHFPEIVDATVELRNKYYPSAAISVLSNATMIASDRIAEALKKIDNPILKIDAPDNRGVELINRPSGKYDLEHIISAMETFNGNFILQTMFLKGDAYDSSDPDNLRRWMDIVRRLSPREIMVYTIDRETPEKNLMKFTVGQMESMVRPLVDEGYRIQIRG